jgi:antitoxin YefM
MQNICKYGKKYISLYSINKIENMRTANYTDLRSNLKGYIDSVIENSDTVIINRGSGAGVVLMSLDEYNSLKETEYIMSSPQMVRRIKQAQKEMQAGKGKRINVDDLWK